MIFDFALPNLSLGPTLLAAISTLVIVSGTLALAVFTYFLFRATMQLEKTTSFLGTIQTMPNLGVASINRGFDGNNALMVFEICNTGLGPANDVRMRMLRSQGEPIFPRYGSETNVAPGGKASFYVSGLEQNEKVEVVMECRDMQDRPHEFHQIQFAPEN